MVSAFFVAGIAFLVAGIVAGIVKTVEPWPWGGWLALHLLFVGGISQLVLGASQFFAGAYLATDRPPRALIRGQLATWNLGSVLLAVAVPSSSRPLIEIAVALLIAGLVLYAIGLARMRRTSLQRAPWATRWYSAGAVCLAVGIVSGAVLAVPLSWPHGNLLAGHMALNLAGWFGAAIVGTLHTFFPSLTQTQLPFPRLQSWTFSAWIAGVAALAFGYGWALDPIAVAGWFCLTAAAAMLLVNVAGCVRAGSRPLSLSARVVGLAQGFLVAGLALATITAVSDGAQSALVGPSRAAIGTLLVAGWIGLTVLGSLAHLLAVVVRVRDSSRAMPTPRVGVDVATATAATAGVIGLVIAQIAGLDVLRPPAAALLLGAYVLLGSRIAVLAARVLFSVRPSI